MSTEYNKDFLRRISGMDLLITAIALAIISFLIIAVFNVKSTKDWADIAKVLGVMVALLSVAIGLIQSSFASQEANFNTALSNIRADDSTVRSMSIGMLKIYLKNNRPGILLPIFGSLLINNRSFIVAEGLANHLAKEKDEFVGEVCIRVLLKADESLYPLILEALCKNNRSLWKQRNRESAKVYRNEFDKFYLKQIGDEGGEGNHDLADVARQRAEKIAQQHAYSFEVPISLTRKAIVGFFKIERPEGHHIGKLVNKKYKDTFKGVHLDYADFSRADLSDCDFTGATLTHVNFKQAKLKRAKFDRAIILNSYFSKTDIEGASFKKAILGCCHFHEMLEGKNDPSPDRMKEALLVVSNKYTGDIKDEDKDVSWKFNAEKNFCSDKNRSIYLTYEFDWHTIWEPMGMLERGKNTNAYFCAEQYTFLSQDVIYMDFHYKGEKTKSGETIIERLNSEDGHNGEYIVEDEFDIRPAHMKYIAGYRTLRGDEHRWEGVCWNLSGIK